jgi:hypothetical protein
MSKTVITERHIDQMYTVIETLSLCSIVLADGNITDKTASSISWLTGQMKEEVYHILTLVEGLHAAQMKGGQRNG